MQKVNMEIKNILITSIMRDTNSDEVNYFCYKKNGDIKFGCRVARSEATAYTLLSETRIDEIIAVGPETGVDANDYVKKEIVRQSGDFLSPDTKCMSDYSFFRYRLCEFLSGVDFEVSDIYLKVPKDRQEELVAAAKHVLGEDISRGFKQIYFEYDLLKKIYDEADVKSKDEEDLIKNFLFNKIRKENRIIPNDENKDIQISYLHLLRRANSSEILTNTERLIELLAPSRDKIINLFVDLQAFNLSDGYTIFNLLNLLDINYNANLVIKSVYSLSSRQDCIAQAIHDESNRFNTSELISGIESFVNHGHVAIIKNYWNRTGLKNEYIDEFIYAMSMVDTGISLCNNDLIINGIKKVIECMQDEERINGMDYSNEETIFIMQIRRAVMDDYASLLSEDGELDLFELIKWEFGKEYYQQAMTIIEAKVPQILVDRGVLYYAHNEEEKQNMLVYLNDCYWREEGRYRWGFNDVDHWLIKQMPRNYAFKVRDFKTSRYIKIANEILKCISDENPERPRLYSEVSDKKAFFELLTSYYALGTLRNHVCHAEVRGYESDEDADYAKDNPILKEISRQIKSFITKMEKVLDDVKGKEFTSVKIDDDEKQEYFNNNKFWPDDDRNGNKSGNRKNHYDKKNNRYHTNDKRTDTDITHTVDSTNDGREIHIHIHL